jgi:hypothetical protein
MPFGFAQHDRGPFRVMSAIGHLGNQRFGFPAQAKVVLKFDY